VTGSSFSERARTRLTLERAWLYGTILALVGLVPLVTIPHFFAITAYHEDWGNFWSGGATVGTPALLDPRMHEAWQIAHGMRPQVFSYPPAVAWLYAPFARLAPLPSFFLEQALMLGVSVVAALLAARIYRFQVSFAIAVTLAWAPLLISIVVGQSTAIALTLTLLAILGLKEKRWLLAGIAVGALLYKPTDSVALVTLLILRGRWRSVAVVGACAALWYIASALATSGNWSWPAQYLELIHGYYHADFAANAIKSVSLPTLALYMGLPQPSAILAGAALFFACAILLYRRPVFEAASMTPLVTLAVSPHAWPYDVGLLLPSICYLLHVGHEPWRTRIVAITYVIAVLPLMHFDPLAIIVLGGTALWFLQPFVPTRETVAPTETQSGL